MAVVTGGIQPLRHLATASLTMVSLTVNPRATISRHIRLAL
ncbi:hypothetical protein OM306_22140 [Escherichia albertii]|nr:hypothetical protein [Escherichia albertii]MCZ8939579.1 hypothetical protein [Escherichia albertii]MCZ8944776.1 hypothetical protein [Escherichia albertii]MCZ8949527.1 hypothetical protein [Escherichia albertii]MCZ8954726.1 hypothetical protein [Escherichia albertii]MCZ8973574.1 hypothetical protein [Escherichia albertii]